MNPKHEEILGKLFLGTVVACILILAASFTVFIIVEMTPHLLKQILEVRNLLKQFN